MSRQTSHLQTPHLQMPHLQMIEIKRWADDGLCGAVGWNMEQLSEGDRFLMLRVLDHIHTVDCIFSCHLQGVPHGFQAARSDTLPAFEPLADAMREMADWYVGYARSLSPEDLDQPVDFVFTSGKPARMTRGQILLHVCLHGTYHRGNAGALLQLRGLTPSRDAITDYLEDLAELDAA